MLSTSLKITAIPAFTDNYIWAIKQNNSPYVALVDPGEPQVCIDYITKNKLQLCAILITHHHHDHIGGIEALFNYCREQNMPLSVYGPASETIPYCDQPLKGDDVINIPLINATFSVMDVPGHTAGHIAFLGNNALFCGDTMFSAGCGRIFNGTAKQLHQSLNTFKHLPEETNVYCTHEYTQANINFALAVEPNNQDLLNYAAKVKQLRAHNQITLPSSIAQEKKINPFLRCNNHSIVNSVMAHQNKRDKQQHLNNQEITDELNTFTLLRKWKDNF